MVLWGWTGSRPPVGGLTIDEALFIALDVARTVNDGDTVGTGGCIGVDEVVTRAVRLLKQVISIKLITFIADKESSWDMLQISDELLRTSDEVRNGMGYLERDRALVEWAHFIRAIPLRPLRRDDSGKIVPVRGSGTAYTASRAEMYNKLIAELPLRPAV